MTPAEKQAFHIKWLKFAILLSWTNLDDLTEGRRLDLKNDFRGFLRSMAQGRPFDVLLELKNHPDFKGRFSDELGDEDLDEARAQVILKRELWNLASDVTPAPGGTNVGIGILSPSVVATMAIGRTGNGPEDVFFFTVWPKDGAERIHALLGYHLQGAAVSASMLRKCPAPACGKVFLITRKPRADRNLHCSIECSSRVAASKYQARMKVLPAAKDLFYREGKSVEDAAQRTGLDVEWLRKRLAGVGRGKVKPKPGRSGKSPRKRARRPPPE